MNKPWIPQPEILLQLGNGGDVSFSAALSFQQYERYRIRPEEVISEITGAPFEVWQEWRESGGRPSCQGVTVAGRPCK